MNDQPTIGLFVVGAMKAATTGMCDWLKDQPGIELSDPKEPAIFVSDEAVLDRGGRLADLFSTVSSDSVFLDGSTDYAKFPAITGVPKRVYEHNKDARIVYMMRHPVERAVSQFRFDWLLGADTMSFERAVETNPQLVNNGRYAFQLREWLAWFAPEQITLIAAEAFARAPAEQVERVLRSLPNRDVVSINRPERERSNDTAALVRHRSLARRVLRDSAVGKVVRPYLPSGLATIYHRRLQQKSMPLLSEQFRRQLVEVFDRDLAELSEMTAGPPITCDTWGSTTETWQPVLRSS